MESLTFPERNNVSDSGCYTWAMAANDQFSINLLIDRQSNGRVYVHCNAGMNRAPTLAIAFLRAYRQMSLDEAMLMVKKQRACGPFMTVLEDYFGARDHKPEK